MNQPQNNIGDGNNIETTVVISSYNGEKYILEQLESIRRQTVKPSEVIIIDDCSKDHTFEVVRNYIKVYDLADWHIYRNEINIGWKINFKRCLDHANGDFIFLCDQDDIWMPDKIQEMLSAMYLNESIGVLASNYELFLDDNYSSRYRKTAARFRNTGHLIKVDFSDRWIYILRPGCTYCIRKSFYEQMKSFWNIRDPHDANLWRVAVLSGKLWILDKPLIRFRRHSGSASGKIESGLKAHIVAVDEYKESCDYYMNQSIFQIDERTRKVLEKEERWYCERISMLTYRQIWKWPGIVFNYYPYYSSILGAFGDLYYMLKG